MVKIFIGFYCLPLLCNSMTPTRIVTAPPVFPNTINSLKSLRPDAGAIVQLFGPDATFQFKRHVALNGGAAGRVIKRQ
jgi:hypothetical protein